MVALWLGLIPPRNMGCVCALGCILALCEGNRIRSLLGPWSKSLIFPSDTVAFVPASTKTTVSGLINPQRAFPPHLLLLFVTVLQHSSVSLVLIHKLKSSKRLLELILIFEMLIALWLVWFGRSSPIKDHQAHCSCIQLAAGVGDAREGWAEPQGWPRRPPSAVSLVTQVLRPTEILLLGLLWRGIGVSWLLTLLFKRVVCVCPLF